MGVLGEYLSQGDASEGMLGLVLALCWNVENPSEFLQASALLL